MRRQMKTTRRPLRRHSGFTLVEMLVSVALVLMLMTLFATIFQIATGSMAKQRGISEQDQRARTISTVVRKDFQHRTFRYPLAFYPGEDSATSPTSFSNRSGYIYISTNDPDTGLDDLIQFTVSANILTEDTDDTPYFGRATELVDRNAAGASPTGLGISPNQPEADDGSLAANSVASSPYAEVCYFIRRGNLYRRVVLIREPLNVAGQDMVPQPTARSGYDYFSGQPDSSDVTTYDGLFKVNNGVFLSDSGLSGTLTNDFHLLFDHAAYADTIGPGQSAQFLGVEALSNETGGAALEVLANPARRFGFNPFTKRSREHTVVPTAGFGPAIFLGRFTQAETSCLNYNWPQNPSTDELLGQTGNVADSATLVGTDMDFDGTIDVVSSSGNPLDIVATPLILNPGNGVVSAYDNVPASQMTEWRGGDRRVEDLLLPNVHEMKIELWDRRLQRYVTPGHSSSNPATGEVGDYHVSRHHNPFNGPIAGVNTGAVFDTWHSTAAAFDFDGSGGAQPLSIGEMSPPYIAYNYYPPTILDSPPGPSPAGMTGPFASYWAPGTGVFNPGVTVVFAPVTFDGDTPTEIFEWENRPPLSGATTDVIPAQAFQIAYRCVAVSDLDSSGTIETSPLPGPVFPTAPGRRITDNEVTWESFDNRRPLQSIRLTFRFHDKTSDNMRQLSLVVPLEEAKK